MLEVDTLRQVLQGKAISAAASLNFPCRIGNEPFNPPQDGSLYGEFWFETNKPKQMELGGAAAFLCTQGILQFTIYAPENTGDGPAIQLGDRLAKMFSRKQWNVDPNGYVKTEPAGVQTTKFVQNGYKATVVDTGFDFYHYDPTATFT